MSKRKVGDESLLDEEINPKKDVYDPYIKTNWDGRKMKSTTATLRNTTGKAIGLLCINLDISKWEQMHSFINDFIKPISDKPEVLFKNDWREKINIYVSDYLKQEGLHMDSLNKEDKRKLIYSLHNEGAFESKNAANYIADVLQISRATVYNYLKEKS